MTNSSAVMSHCFLSALLLMMRTVLLSSKQLKIPLLTDMDLMAVAISIMWAAANEKKKSKNIFINTFQ